jgi:hypothetical protein
VVHPATNARKSSANMTRTGRDYAATFTPSCLPPDWSFSANCAGKADLNDARYTNSVPSGPEVSWWSAGLVERRIYR